MITADLMSRSVVTVSPDHSVNHAARLMLEHGISGLPVLDDHDVVVGIITEGDLLCRVDISPADGTDALWHRLVAPDGAARDFVRKHSWRVGDVMSAPVVHVRDTTPLRKVSELLQSYGIRRLPVINDGRLVGIVSRADLLRHVLAQLPGPALRGDEALRIGVEARLRDAGNAMSARPGVTVEQGIAHLWGELGSESERHAARVAAETVRGLAGVEDHTTIRR